MPSVINIREADQQTSNQSSPMNGVTSSKSSQHSTYSRLPDIEVTRNLLDEAEGSFLILALASDLPNTKSQLSQELEKDNFPSRVN